MNLVMLGTGDFAAPTFAALYTSPHSVAALFTQPERTGPGHHRTQFNPLKQIALEKATPVHQPENINTPESLALLRSLQPDVIVVAAYGQILSPELIALPRLAIINVHASLLPKYRGAAPVNYAILQGDRETGVSIIDVVKQLDAGPVYATVTTPISLMETAGELEDRLAQLGAPLTLQVLDQIAQGTAQPVPQDHARHTKAPKLSKTMGLIDWTKSALDIHRQIRGLQPWPYAYTYIPTAKRGPLRVLVHSATILEESPAAATHDLASELTPPTGWTNPVPPLPPSSKDSPTAEPPTAISTPLVPGSIVRAEAHGLVVQTGHGQLSLQKIQPEGKRAMTISEFLNGYPLTPGQRLSPPP